MLKSKLQKRTAAGTPLTIPPANPPSPKIFCSRCEKKKGVCVLRIAKQGEPLRDFLSPANRKETRNQAKAHGYNSRHDGQSRKISLAAFESAARCSNFPWLQDPTQAPQTRHQQNQPQPSFTHSVLKSWRGDQLLPNPVELHQSHAARRLASRPTVFP